MRIVDIREKDKAERAGFVAGKSGKPASSCPYEEFKGKQTVETMCNRMWMSGWARGKIEFKRNLAKKSLGM